MRSVYVEGQDQSLVRRDMMVRKTAIDSGVLDDMKCIRAAVDVLVHARPRSWGLFTRY